MRNYFEANYYKMLGLDDDLSEKELLDKIHQMIEDLRKETFKSDDEKLKCALKISVCNKFIMTINRYGSKENYDHAIGLKKHGVRTRH